MAEGGVPILNAMQRGDGPMGAGPAVADQLAVDADGRVRRTVIAARVSRAARGAYPTLVRELARRLVPGPWPSLIRSTVGAGPDDGATWDAMSPWIVALAHDILPHVGRWTQADDDIPLVYAALAAARDELSGWPLDPGWARAKAVNVVPAVNSHEYRTLQESLNCIARGP